MCIIFFLRGPGRYRGRKKARGFRSEACEMMEKPDLRLAQEYLSQGRELRCYKRIRWGRMGHSALFGFPQREENFHFLGLKEEVNSP